MMRSRRVTGERIPRFGQMTTREGTSVEEVMCAVGSGELGPTQGAVHLTSLGSLAKLKETDDLTPRMR